MSFCHGASLYIDIPCRPLLIPLTPHRLVKSLNVSAWSAHQSGWFACENASRELLVISSCAHFCIKQVIVFNQMSIHLKVTKKKH